MNPEQSTSKPANLDAVVKDYLETGSPTARQDMVAVGQALINYYAGIYSQGQLDKTLQLAAKEGFLGALKRYNLSCELPFSTYATQCIISSIRQELLSRQIFKTPEWLKRIQDDVINATAELAEENEALPTLEDIAKRVNIHEEGIAEVMQAGRVSSDKINVSLLKSVHHDTFKLPIEDVIKIRKSMDRLKDIQRKVLSVISVNIKELNMAIEEEEMALSSEQAQYLRLIGLGDGKVEEDYLKSFKMDFPEKYSEEEILRYFEVLSDEFGLNLKDLQLKEKSEQDEVGMTTVQMAVDLEGRYRGLLRLLDHLRKVEKVIRVDKVNTTRNENIPARINTRVTIRAFYNGNISP